MFLKTRSRPRRQRSIGNATVLLLVVIQSALLETGCRHMMRTHREYDGRPKNTASVSRLVVAYPNLPISLDGKRAQVSGKRPYFEVFELLPGAHTMEVTYLYRPLYGPPHPSPANGLQLNTRAGMMYLIKDVHLDDGPVHFVTDPMPMRVSVPNTSRTVYLDTSTEASPDDTGDNLSFFVEENGQTTEYSAFNSKNAILPSYSEDRKHIAFTWNQRDNVFEWIVDGVPEGHRFDRLLTGFAFSKDGSRYAYVGRDRNQNYLVVDGQKTEATYDNFANILFSPDNRYLVVTALLDGRVFIRINDKVRGPYEEITVPSFGKIKGHLTYFAKKTDRWKLYFDNHIVKVDFESPAHPWVVFSPDESSYFCLVNRKNRVAVYTKKRLQKGYDSVSFPIYSPDSRHLAYMGSINNREKDIVVLDGREVGVFEEIEPDSIGFDEAGSHLFFKKKVNGAWQMVSHPLANNRAPSPRASAEGEVGHTVFSESPPVAPAAPEPNTQQAESESAPVQAAP